jgi:plastocyanin
MAPARFAAIRARRRRCISYLVVVLTLGLLAAGCGTQSHTAALSAATKRPDTIVIDNFGFSPPVLTVSPGAQVTITNHDAATHTVSATGNGFRTVVLPPHATTTLTAPSKAGSYSYMCDIHESMRGTLVVR